ETAGRVHCGASGTSRCVDVKHPQNTGGPVPISGFLDEDFAFRLAQLRDLGRELASRPRRRGRRVGYPAYRRAFATLPPTGRRCALRNAIADRPGLGPSAPTEGSERIVEIAGGSGLR